ncbi:hypothetical protein [Nocardia colli]|uniref:hypothetical protein n=2 Tax=Nocardia colli TaxID=2545717 RepID=UPI0035DE82ED
MLTSNSFAVNVFGGTGADNGPRRQREKLDMKLKSKQVQRFSGRSVVIAAVTGAALVGLAAPSVASPTDPVVHFSPTLTRAMPGGGDCAAIINAETVPQPQAGTFGVRLKITQTGERCGAYRVAVRWRNLDTGIENGQSHRVTGTVIDAKDNIITGFGTAPGVGRVEAHIVTTTEDHRDMEHLSGDATFTLR